MQQTRDQMYERTVGYLKAERLHTKVNSKEISTWKVHNPRGHYLRVVSVEKGTECWFVETVVMNEIGRGGGGRMSNTTFIGQRLYSLACL